MNLPLPARALSKLIQAIGYVSSNREDIFDLAAGQIMELFDVDVCFFSVPAKDGGMRVAGVKSSDRRLENALAGKVFANPCPAFRDGMLVCVHDTAADDTCSDGLLRGWAGSHLCVPLTIRGNRLGSMTVAAKSSHMFSPEEIDLYLSIASLVAIAVQNADMYSVSERQACELRDQVREKTRKVSAVNRISERINAATSREEVMAALTDGINDIAACDAATVALIDGGSVTVSVVRGNPPGIASEPVPLSETALGEVAKAGKARVHSGGVPDHARYLVGRGRSFAIAPLVAGDRIFGSLNMARTRSPNLKHSDLPNLVQVAGQVAAALMRIELFERERNAASELKTLYDASSAFTSTVRMRDTLRIISRQLAEATRSAACLLFKLDGESVTLAASYGGSIDRAHPSLRVAVPPNFLRSASSARQVTPEEQTGSARGWLKALARHLGENIMLVPIVDRDEPVAAAIVARPGDPFGEADLRVASAIAGQAAVAIQASQVYEHERTIAEVFQKSLLPPPDYRRAKLCVAGKYQPALEEADVGGDFYDIIEIDDDLVGIAVGDISGKGLIAATQAAAVQHMLEAYAIEDPSPSVALARLNNAVCHSLREGFATLFYGLIDLKRCTLTYANAGHELPVRMSNGRPCHPLEVTGPALAISPDAIYSDLTIEMGERDLVLCYTDGITEARRGEGFWGYEGLVEALRDCPSHEPRIVVDHVYERALEYSRGRLADDVALLAITQGEGF
ncbi:MAG: SpoIIE family protein phosphatase [Armatimonadota bacterium]|nr:SpoIIE family protein phosphatase [Armatimonadota bacterium]